MVKSTDAGISQRTNVWAARAMLRHAGPTVILNKFGVTKQMPKNKGVNVKFRRPVPFSAATTPLTEGVTPAARSFGYEDVTAALQQYGEVAEITDVIQDTHEDPVLQDLTVQLGENIGRTEEALYWAELRSGTNVMYSNGSARNAVNTPISLSKQRAATRALKAQKGMKITRVLTASPDYETRAVEAAFVAVAHTDMEADIRDLAGFVPVARYGTMSPICAEEIGAVEDVRYILSADLDPYADAGATAGSMVSTTGTVADVYPVLFLAKEAYGNVPLRGLGSVEPTIIPVSQKDKSDPLGQRGYAGWKTWFVAKILNDGWMLRLECAVTDL